MDADIAIVGGGIVGSTAALTLQEAGLSTIVFEPMRVGAGTAEGSAGYLHDGEIFPLPHPQLLGALPRMLLDPMGPLVFRPAYLPHLVGWSARFFRSMSARTHRRGAEALAALNRRAIDAMLALAATAGATDLLVRQGGLKVCRDPRSVDKLSEELVVLERYGISAQLLGARELRDMEPSLAPDMAGGAFFPDSAHCVDLAELGNRFAARIRERAAVVPFAASRIRPLGDGWIVEYVDEKTKGINVRRVLVAAGHASGALLQPLGYRVPLAPARGYHLMLHDPGIELRHPVIFHEPHFAATPMRNGVRLAGTMEFAAARSAPDMRRADMLYTLALPYLPGIRRSQTTSWMGVRPLTPDDLPILGRAHRHQNLYCSFGHGHLGLTQSAISARCIADVVLERMPPLDLEPFRLARFDAEMG